MNNFERIAKLGQMIWCVKPSQFRIKEMRDQMTLARRLEFRQTIKEHSLKHYAMKIHHIIPLSYGGTNKFSNLCLVDETTHDLLHFYMFQMNKPMKDGQRGCVWIPMIQKKYSLFNNLLTL